MTEQKIPENFVYSIAISPAYHHDHICFAAQQSGLYRSCDAGQSWENVTAYLSKDTPLAVQLVTFSPDFERDHTLYAVAHGGVLRSIDKGETWQTHIMSSPPPFASALVFSPNYALDGKAFCATVEDGVFCTHDRGGHWAAWNFGLLDLQVLSLAIAPQFAKNDIIIAGTESGIYRSKNGGRAWRTIDLPFDVEMVTSLAFAPDGRLLFAGTANGDLLCSNDHGSSWALTSHFENGIDQIVVGPGSENPHNVLLLSDSVLYISYNAGQDWKVYSEALARAEEITCVAVPEGDFSSGSILAGTVDQGIVEIK